MAGDLETEARYRWDEIENLEAALRDFQSRFDLPTRFGSISVAYAGLALSDQERFDLTNRDQSFSRSLLAQFADQVYVINDFAAQASLIPHVSDAQVRMIKSGEQHPGAKAVLGPGTGLGVAGLTASGQVIPGEGGHVALPALASAPFDALQKLLGRTHVRLEDVLSGTGLENLHQALGARPETAQNISKAALAGDATARETFALFFDYLALACANQALQYVAAGGVYLVGNISLQNIDLMDPARFAHMFETVISHQEFLEQVPAYLVLTETSGLAGAAAYLATC